MTALVLAADEAWAHVVATQPYYTFRSGLPVERLPHGSIEEAQRDAAVGRSIRARLDAVDPAGLTADDRNTFALLEHLSGDWSMAEESWWWRFPVAPYQSYELALYGNQVLQSFSPAGPADVDRYLSLASDIAAWARVAREKLAAQGKRGWGIPHAALDGFIATVRGHRDSAGSWLRPDPRRLGPADRGKLADGAEKILAGEILPEFDALLGYLSGPLETTGRTGLAQYPGGEEAYRHLVASNATFAITPEEVHQLGLEQVAQLGEQMAEVRAEAGFDGDELAYRRVLEADARFHAAAPGDVEATYRRHLRVVEPVVDQWFRVLPKAPYEVERLDPALEAGMSFGYYEPPNQQTPVGRYRYNGSGLDTRSQINAAALILHELVPGHHFHLARQAEDTSLHPLRGQVAPMALGAYTEGWGEYAASLGFEMGVYADPWDRYGAYQHQRMVAQRLVVDTGLNLYGWSLERAAEYMTGATMESPRQVRTEILRYSTDLPGQALGYRLGWRKLWLLRERAERALGAAFDVRDFHELVLGAGALPLTAVEANVDRWISGATRLT
ncbi:DUF885 domain-containing protein [Amycolatopsis saalfeldensis]|uniref:Uncharacterized conserved protein, DUF885 familyt n=1 Tax=Amycolatopsis saalfeldensis TaxID=394193 RepID=A0A1H8Y4N2_9PSEU|nr:DUF885 domain-containing protein [Amycolatopsis saalfeldensis]SEP47032.1 Uncharacterized conserved protein, DUF885 familyt [Amycolatopsis saalfeldensis]